MEIHDLAFGGDGVGRIENMVCFVPYTAPGDIVSVEIRERKKKFLRAGLTEIITPSPYRNEPRCPLFGSCGGCQWQHIQYKEQLRAKQEHLKQILKKNAGIDFPVEEIYPSPGTYHYRRSGRMQITETGDLGFFARASRQIVPVQSCPVFEDTLNARLPVIREDLKARTPRPSELELVSQDGSETEFAFLFSEEHSKLGFIQANAAVNLRLQNFIRTWIADFSRREDLVLDLFCGDGNLTLHLSDLDVRVLGYDISQAAVKRAVSKAAAGGLSNFTYKHAPVQNSKKELLDLKGKVKALICDPPRQGLFDMAALIASIQAPLLIYVSCFPAILARDLQALISSGYTLRTVQPMDMFPQTYHLETAAVLTLQKGGPV